jgi:hypothetical protein
MLRLPRMFCSIDRVKYIVWSLFLFLLIGVGIGWAMYPFSH